ncbi:hypothetical protein LCGC14_0861240 [marine sediment metagenome]|uniref:Uncharacterized protein n=1 Tax=marine sediment metagenome TaxID=412755 RepID=A0A0F9PCG0_9ZZZZ
MKVETDDYDKEKSYIEKVRKIFLRGLVLDSIRIFDWGGKYEVTLKYKKKPKKESKR